MPLTKQQAEEKRRVDAFLEAYMSGQNGTRDIRHLFDCFIPPSRDVAKFLVGEIVSGGELTLEYTCQAALSIGFALGREFDQVDSMEKLFNFAIPEPKPRRK